MEDNGRMFGLSDNSPDNGSLVLAFGPFVEYSQTAAQRCIVSSGSLFDLWVEVGVVTAARFGNYLPKLLSRRIADNEGR